MALWWYDLAVRDRITVDVVSDIVCPWCFIGKRRLECAAPILGVAIDIRWHPFQLNPRMPMEGIDRREYRVAKFGSWEYSRQLDARVAENGSAVGIEFRHDLMARTPNSFRGHVLLAAALKQGGVALQDVIAERLFTGYFTKGEDVGDSAVLKAIAQEYGVTADLNDTALADPVSGEEEAAREAGVQGVPLISYRGQVVSEGAAPEQMLAARLKELISESGDNDAV
jgi:predicted DsbA family dithiol-disulfide isomerase